MMQNILKRLKPGDIPTSQDSFMLGSFSIMVILLIRKDHPFVQICANCVENGQWVVLRETLYLLEAELKHS